MSTQRIKPGKASLVGGIAVAFAALALWTAIAHQLAVDSAPVLLLGLLVAVGVGTWIRAADL